MAVETEAISAELAGVLDLLGRARERVGSTAGYAGSVAERATAIGMAGVATALTSVRAEIAALNTGVDAATGATRQAMGAVGGVRDPTQTDRARAPLNTAAEQVNAARGALVGVARQIATIKARVEVVLRGAQPGPLLGRLDSLRQYLVAAVGRLDAAEAKIATAAVHGDHLGKQQGRWEQHRSRRPK